MSAVEVRMEGRPAVVVTSPGTGEPIGEVPDQGPEEVRGTVARAREAQRGWAARSVRERCRLVLGFRDQLVDRAEELAELLSREQGKTRQEALAMEVLGTAGLITYFCKHGPRILAPEPIRLGFPILHRKSYVAYVPRGVVAIISPWNFPLSIPLGDAIMALVAGNAVVIKPSDVTPLIALRAKELFDAAGLPRDLVQIVTGRGETGAALVDARPDKVVFTGSVATGRRVAAACAERLIPCALELGGKAPALVCADADVERTARALVWGAFANSGQVCCSVERAYVNEAVYDELLARVVGLTRELRQGDPLSDDTDVGAMTWARQLEIVEERVGQALSAGAEAAAGGHRRPGAGRFFEPTVLVGCRQDMDVMRKEIFGPVLPIMKVRDDEQAVALANDSHLGLLAYVFTKDRDKGKRLAERIEAGTVMVNDVLSSYAMPETPWHGIKESGMGRTHSDRGLRDMCLERHVNYDRFRPMKREPFWYPYSARGHSLLKKALRFLYKPSRR